MIDLLLLLLRRVLPPQARTLLRRRRYRSVTRRPRWAADGNDLVRRGHVVVFVKGTRPTWLLARCPCRCGYILHVNLMPEAEPSWHLTVDGRGGATVTPSLIVTPCGSHFWITGGRVRWV